MSPNVQRQVVRLLSLDELLRKLERSKGWKLSITQRAFEWDPRRVTNLVDSLLRGFPIGTLLLHRTKRPFYELAGDKTMRDLKKNGERVTEQLLDGQQRCEALRASFGGKGLNDPRSEARLYLWINVQEPNKANREFHDERGQKYYFHWSTTRSGLNGLTGPERKQEDLPPGSPATGWIPFSRLLSFIAHDEPIATIIDDAQVPDPLNAPKGLVSTLKKQVLAARAERRIPVHILDDSDTEVYDVHQLFIRINTGGIILGQADIFFAAVKKYWPDAEEHLRPLVGDKSLLNRRGAISLLARCAGLSLSRKAFDPARLHPTDLVRHGTGDASPLVARMKELTPARGTSPLVDETRRVSGAIERKFYRGSRELNATCVSAVIAWAFGYNLKTGESPIKRKRLPQEAARFLFWTHLVGSRTYGRSKFDREVVKRAWEAGRKGKTFPYEDKPFQKLCFQYGRALRYLPDDPAPGHLRERKDDRWKILQLMNGSRRLVCCVFQRVEHTDLDWDHILAYKWASKRYKKGRRLDWPVFNWINQVGNFAAIDARANRALQDVPPSKKLTPATADDPRSYLSKSFIKAELPLTEEEIGGFLRIEEMHTKEGKATSAPLLAEVIGDRSYRIWKHLLAEFGEPPRPNDFPPEEGR